MSFYTFNQNNSGGSFQFRPGAGISSYVIIEADDDLEAEYLASRIGLYFNGVEDGIDCGCCGDRWYFPYGDPTEEPEVYGKVVRPNQPFVKEGFSFKWMDGPEGYIHYKDNRVEPFYV